MSNESVTAFPASTANSSRGVQRITLTLSNETGKLQIECDIRSQDEGLAMIHRAICQLETRLKFAIGRDIVQEEAQNKQLAAVAAAVARGGGRGA